MASVHGGLDLALVDSLLILKYPSSPQVVPQELAMSQY